MSEKLEILYPRVEAKLYIMENKEEQRVLKKIAAIKKSKTFQRYEKLQENLADIEESKPTFACGRCNATKKTKELVCHVFVTYSNTMDNDRYEDYNIICPNCGCFNYIEKDVDRFFGYKNRKYIE